MKTKYLPVAIGLTVSLWIFSNSSNNSENTRYANKIDGCTIEYASYPHTHDMKSDNQITLPSELTVFYNTGDCSTEST